MTPPFMQRGRERQHIGCKQYRHEIRPTARRWREYKLKAYLLDTLNPDTETEVDLTNLTTCTFGKCDDPGNTYEKHIAFVVDADRYQDFVEPGIQRAYYGSLKICYNVSVTYYMPLGPRKSGDIGYVRLGEETANWNGNLYTWNNRPSDPSQGQSASFSGLPNSATIEIADLWNVAASGSTRIWNAQHGFAVYNGYGYRLWPNVFASAPGTTGYPEISITLTDWKFLCE